MASGYPIDNNLKTFLNEKVSNKTRGIFV